MYTRHGFRAPLLSLQPARLSLPWTRCLLYHCIGAFSCSFGEIVSVFQNAKRRRRSGGVPSEPSASRHDKRPRLRPSRPVDLCTSHRLPCCLPWKCGRWYLRKQLSMFSCRQRRRPRQGFFSCFRSSHSEICSSRVSAFQGLPQKGLFRTRGCCRV